MNENKFYKNGSKQTKLILQKKKTKNKRSRERAPPTKSLEAIPLQQMRRAGGRRKDGDKLVRFLRPIRANAAMDA